MVSTKQRMWLFVAALGGISALSVPPGVAAVGVVLGGLTSLLAVGLVLAYRAHGFVNLSHAALGAVAGTGVSYLVAHAGWSFWGAYPAGLAAGAALGVLSGIVLGERLADASRTVALAGSLGLAFVFGAAHVALGLATGSVLAFEVPIPLSVEVFPVRLSGTHVFAAITVPVALAGVWFFLQRSDIGLRVRALAGNARHARRIGVDPRVTWRALWVVIGVLAAAAGIVSQPLLGTTVARGPLLGPLLFALAGAAVGGMRDLPLAAGGSVAISVAYQAILWRSPVAALADVALLAVVVIAFGLRATRDRLDERRDPPHHRLVRSPRPAAARWRGVLAICRPVAAVACVAIIGGLVRFLDAGDAQRIGSIGIFVLAGLSVHVVATFRGSLSLGTWALVGAGAVVFSRTGSAPALGIAAAIVGAALLSACLAVLSARGGALAYSAVTLTGAFAFAALLTRLPAAAVPVSRVGPVSLDDPRAVAVVVAAATACVALAIGILRRSRFGRGALAVREDPTLAAVHGLHPGRTRVAVDAFAGGIAGLAGTLYVVNQRVVHPDAFDAVRSLELVAMTVTGGIGSVVGPFLGGAVVKGSELFARGPLHLLATGAGVLVVVVWLRGGLVSLGELARTRWNGREAARAPERYPPGALAPRFCPAPAGETRKARRDGRIRQLAATVFFAGACAGIAVRVAALGRSEAVTVWIVMAALGVASAAAAVGHRRPRLVAAAAATIVVSGAAFVWTPVAFLSCVTAGYAFGSALRLAAGAAAQPLVHASRGWITAQAAAGAAVGAAFAGVGRPATWLAFAGIATLAVATIGRVRPEPMHTARAPGSLLRLDAVHVTVGGTRVLAGLDLDVRAAEIVGIAGTNGVGKTTLLRSIAGEVPIDAGSIFLRHADIGVLGAEEVFGLGVMLSDAENGSTGDLTVRENIRLATLSSHHRSAAREVVASVASLHPSIGQRLDDRASVLSGGERRLLALAQVAVVQPAVLLVDELARGLSADALDTYRALLRRIAASGSAVVVVDHDAAGLRDVADRVLRLHDGRLTSDTRELLPT